MTSHLQSKKKFKIMRFVILISLIILSIIFIFLFRNKNNIEDISASTPTSAPTNIIEEAKEDITIKFTAIGDIMCHNTQYKDAFNSKDNSYDFSYVFSEIEDFFKGNDLNIGNLETTFHTGREYSSYPTFNTPVALATDLKELGLNVVSTANNHCMDTGNKGLISTLDVLDSVGIEHTGTYRTPEERETLLIKDIKGIKTAFLSYTYGTNGIPVPSDKPYSVNLIDKDKILNDLQKAKDSNVDLICCNMHWGAEYLDSPNKEQQELCDFLLKNGVDIILGSHPHVLEKMEKINVTTVDGEEKECFVIYSLGNFVSGQVKTNTRTSIILNFEVTKNGETGSISIDNINYIPIYCNTSGTSKKYKLINIKKEIENYDNGSSKYITSSTISFFRKELERVQKVLNWNL